MKPLMLLPRLVEKLDDVLDRLDLLLPRLQNRVDWSQVPAAIWKKHSYGGQMESVYSTPNMTLDDILGINRQKTLVVKNTEQFVRGLPANNVLLSGSRGTGKSSLIKALLNEYVGDGLRVIQVDKTDLADLSAIVTAIAGAPYRFILYCDDLSFDAQDEGYKALKSALDGGIFTTPDNILVYATSNRRHLMPEYLSDNREAKNQDTEIHHAEVVEEKVSLSDRFGLWVSLYPINQQTYLDIARHWVSLLAEECNLEIDWSTELDVLCVRWADNRGTRSGRTAYQFARHWVGQQLLTAESS